jgi:hypothetical protein
VCVGDGEADEEADNGSLTEAELRTALVNGDWSPFDPHTVRMMIRYDFLLPKRYMDLALTHDIRMFDTDRSGSVNFDEFWYHPFSPPLSSPILIPSTAAYGVSSPPGAVFLTASMRTIAAPSLLQNSMKHSSPLGTACHKVSSPCYTKLTTEVAGTRLVSIFSSRRVLA